MALPSSATNRMLFVLAGVGVVAGVTAAIALNRHPAPQPAMFDPVKNPYAQGIYANGIVESDQPHGSNVNVYPEVAGTVIEIVVQPGEEVHRGATLLKLDDSVQRANVEQQRAQAEAAQALLDELRQQPRPESLRVAEAQLAAAEASAKMAKDTYDKQQHAFDIDAHAISRDALDTARNAWRVAEANEATAQRQLDLTRAGAWAFDIRNQAAQQQALEKAWEASNATLSKYTLHAPADGVVLAVNATVGSYVAPQGQYNAYTHASNDPLLVLGSSSGHLQVRCYVDEILIPRLPPPDAINAEMSVRGTKIKVPLEFVRIEPYVTPKISLSDQRQERVDVRVLPVIFRFPSENTPKLYAGQLVDVYIGASP